MSPNNTSSSLPDTGADDSTAGLGPLSNTGDSQQTDADVLSISSPGPQTRSRPTTARDEHEATNTSSQSKQPRADATKGVAYVTDLMRKLGIPALTKSLSRGLQHEVLKQHPRALRTYESAHADGAWITGDVSDNMLNLTYAQRLHHLGVLGGKEVRRQGLAFHHSESAEDRGSAQSSYASSLHISVPSVPGIVVLAPPHSSDAVFSSFRDPLMSNIRVSLIPSNSHNTIMLIQVAAPTSLHAASCAYPPS